MEVVAAFFADVSDGVGIAFTGGTGRGCRARRRPRHSGGTPAASGGGSAPAAAPALVAPVAPVVPAAVTSRPCLRKWSRCRALSRHSLARPKRQRYPQQHRSRRHRPRPLRWVRPDARQARRSARDRVAAGPRWARASAGWRSNAASIAPRPVVSGLDSTRKSGVVLRTPRFGGVAPRSRHERIAHLHRQPDGVARRRASGRHARARVVPDHTRVRRADLGPASASDRAPASVRARTSPRCFVLGVRRSGARPPSAHRLRGSHEPPAGRRCPGTRAPPSRTASPLTSAGRAYAPAPSPGRSSHARSPRSPALESAIAAGTPRARARGGRG